MPHAIDEGDRSPAGTSPQPEAVLTASLAA